VATLVGRAGSIAAVATRGQRRR